MTTQITIFINSNDNKNVTIKVVNNRRSKAKSFKNQVVQIYEILPFNDFVKMSSR